MAATTATLPDYYIEDARDILTTVGLDLTPEFFTPLLARPREKIVIGGWRGGKTSELAAEAQCEIAAKVISQSTTPFLIWLVGPDYVQTHEEFRYLEEWNRKLGWLISASMPGEGQWQMKLKGNITIETKSAAHYERLGSVAPDFIGVCESGQVSDLVRTMLIGRSAQKRARIVYTGTLEDDEGHQQWAWYQEKALEWANGAECQNARLHDCKAEHAAFSLPSWANRAVFAGGRDDPEIKRMELEFDPFTFARRIAAIPTGVQFQVYHQLNELELEDCPPDIRWIDGAGGIDYGTDHPTTLSVIKVAFDPRDAEFHFKAPQGIAWVVESWLTDIDPGDHYRLNAEKQRLAHKWGIYKWGTDPNERFMARQYGATAVSGSAGARGARIGLVQARLNLGKLRFWKGGAGTAELKSEMQRIHKRKLRDGELKLVTNLDDRTAALEDAVEVLDGAPGIVSLGKPTNLVRPYPRRSYTRQVRV